MRTLDYYIGRDELNLRLLESKMRNAEIAALAQQSALEQHPVVEYVMHLPVESTLYPAIRYLKTNLGSVKGKEKGISKDVQEKEQETIQESPLFIDDTVQEIDLDSPIGKSIKDYNEWAFGQGILSQDVEEAVASNPSILDQETDFEDIPYITWSMPGSDHTRPKEKGCGFISSSDNNGPLYVSCESSIDHHCKAKRKHCWSLLCPNCMNDTALKNGIEVERQFLTYAKLSAKQGIDVGRVKHWVVSPPQEYAKSALQRADTYDELCRYIQDAMVRNGSAGGFMITHPWRQKKDIWEFSPHFHILSYGHVNTKAFLKENPGWIIKLVHSKENIKSIRHTAAYLFTHMGIPKSERLLSEVDFDHEVLNYMLPGLNEINTKEQKLGMKPEYHYSDKDYDKAAEKKGRMVGDLSDIDWVEWTKSKLCREYRTRYYGSLSRTKLRLVGVYRTYRARRCKECGCLLKIHDGFADCKGKQANYIRDIGVYAFAKDYNTVMAEINNYRSVLRENHLTIVDMSKAVALMISSDELGMDDDRDIVLEHPLSVVTIHSDGSITQEVAA